MKIKNHFVRLTAAAVIVSFFTMCTKNSILIEEKLVLASSKNSAMAVVPEGTVGSGTYTVQPNEWFVDGTNMQPGTIIYIPAGTRGALLLKNLKGTPDNPIIITNAGGKATLSTSITASYGFKTQNCRYFKVLGTGDPGIKYGIEVNGGNIGMTMDDLSSDFEITAVEVRNSGFAGIMAKTDPTCDVATQRGNFTMRNVKIHHNYIHKTGGEGLYIGNSFYAEGILLACGRAFPHDIVNAKIYNNRIDSTGAEGIQIGSATQDCIVCRNTIKNPGLSPFANWQNNGIQIGEGTGGKCYSNLIKNAPGNGIILLGLGDNLVFDNVIIDAGANGIFADSRYTPGPNFEFINNTIISPGAYGIRLNSETIPMNTVINNAIINAGLGIAIYRSTVAVKLTSFNNYIGADINALKFVNFAKEDFHLQETSPLINAGIDATVYGVNIDYYGEARPLANAFDIGATEY
jgi:hypothetical protein